MKLSIPESEEKKLRHHVTNMGILGGWDGRTTCFNAASY